MTRSVWKQIVIAVLLVAPTSGRTDNVSSSSPVLGSPTSTGPDGVPVRWLVLRSADGAVMWLDEHLVQDVISSTWATTTFSDLEVKEATDPMPNVGAVPPTYTVTLGSGTLIVGYVGKGR